MNIIERLNEASKPNRVRNKLQKLDSTIDEFMDMLEDKAMMIEDNPTFQQQVLQLLADTTKEHGEFMMAIKRVAQALDSKSQKLSKIKAVGKQTNPYGGPNPQPYGITTGGQNETPPEETQEVQELWKINEAENPVVKKGKNVVTVMINMRKELEDLISNMSGEDLVITASSMIMLKKAETQYLINLTKILKRMK